MGRRNIILTSTVLVIIAIIISIGLDIVKASALGVTRREFGSATVAYVLRQSVPGVLEKQALVVDGEATNELKRVAPHVNAGELSSVSPHSVGA